MAAQENAVTIASIEMEKRIDYVDRNRGSYGPDDYNSLYQYLYGEQMLPLQMGTPSNTSRITEAIKGNYHDRQNDACGEHTYTHGNAQQTALPARR